MRFNRRRVIALSAVLGIVALSAAAVYLLRAPALLVLDAEFTALYGPSRSALKKAELSLKLFRRVKVARVDDGASPDVVAFAAAEAAAKPYGALFPARYSQGARRYAEQAEGIPVGVLGSGSRIRSGELGDQGAPGVPLVIETDRRLDFYRAGRCAALFARSGGGGVLFFGGDLVSWEDRDAFLKGLRDQGFENSPLFVGKGEAYALPAALSCVVMAGPAEDYLENNPTVPIILFSWLDPGICPREVKLVFDDSPWALAAAALRAIRRGEARPVPSEILAPKGRIGDARLRRDIKKAARSEYIN
jgi:hypothetical protein